MQFRRSGLFALAAILIALDVPLSADSALPFSSARRSASVRLDLGVVMAAASNGTDFLVLWSGEETPPDMYNSSTDPQYPYPCRIYARPYTAGGSTSEIASVPLTDRLFRWAQSAHFTLGRAGDGYLATWGQGSSGYVAGFLDAKGEVRRTVNLPLAVVEAATNGSRHLLVSSDEAMILDDDGTTVAAHIPADPRGCQLPGGCEKDADSFCWSDGCSGNRRIVPDANGGFLIVLKRNAAGADHVYARRISPAGMISGWFEVLARPASIGRFAVVAEGAQERLIWTESGSASCASTLTIDAQSNTPGPISAIQAAGVCDLLGAIRVGNTTWLRWASPSPSLTPLNNDQLPTITLPGNKPIISAIATDGQRLLYVSWGNSGSKFGPNFPTEIYASIVWPAVTPRVVMSRIHAVQDEGSVASAGDRTLVLWSEADGGIRSIYAARFASDGSLDPLGILISSGGVNRHAEAAFNGVDWLVAWRRYRGLDKPEEIVARRLSVSGTVVGDEIVLGESWCPPWAERELNYLPGPRITSDGTNWLVAWIEPDSLNRGGPAMRAVVRRVAPSGVLLDAEPRRVGPATQNVSNARLAQRSIDVAWDGTNYIAVWDEGLLSRFDAYQRGYVDSSVIAGAFLAPDLSRVGDTFFVNGEVKVTDSDPYDDEYFPHVVVNSKRVLITWWYPSDSGHRYAFGDRPDGSRKRAIQVGRYPRWRTSGGGRGTPIGATLLPNGYFVVANTSDYWVLQVQRFTEKGELGDVSWVNLASGAYWRDPNLILDGHLVLGIAPLRGIAASGWTVTVPISDTNDRAWLQTYDYWCKYGRDWGIPTACPPR